jgi:hypothetical protein
MTLTAEPPYGGGGMTVSVYMSSIVTGPSVLVTGIRAMQCLEMATGYGHTWWCRKTDANYQNPRTFNVYDAHEALPNIPLVGNWEFGLADVFGQYMLNYPTCFLLDLKCG